MDSNRDFSRGGSKMMEGGREMVGAAQDVANQTMEDVKSGLSQGKETLKRYAAQAKDTAAEYAKEAKNKTEEQIKTNPFWAIMIAAGIGLTFGLILATAAKRES